MIALAHGGRFPLGEVTITPNAAAKIPPAEVESALRRHARGDWGELDPGDRTENERALERGSAIASIFTAKSGITFYIITEGDRSVTTVLLPEEF